VLKDLRAAAEDRDVGLEHRVDLVVGAGLME